MKESSPQGEHCPVDHRSGALPTGMRLIQSSYAEAAAAFEDYAPYTTPEGFLMRGGYPHTRKPRAIYPRTESVESSFNQLQQNYNRATIAALYKLASGEPLVPTELPCKPFAAQITERLAAQLPARAVFVEAVTESVIDLYERFGRIHPNLMPSLQAMKSVGLTGGMGIVAHESLQLPHSAQHLKGDTPDATREALHTRMRLLAPNAPAQHFTSGHDREGKPLMEVWCPAISVAQLLLRQMSAAAAEAVHMPGFAAKYEQLYEIRYHAQNAIGPLLMDVIDQAALEAKTQHNEVA